MNHEDLRLPDALHLAEVAELRAADLYADVCCAADVEPASAKAVRETGRLRETDEVKEIWELDKKTAMAIITVAIDIEQEAEKRSADLAERTSDPGGRSIL